MADEVVKPRLGRGLAALLGDADGEFGSVERNRGDGSRRVPVEFLRRNPRNPRTQFDVAELDELAESIRERGIIQPIVVRALRDLPDVFEIIAGERRWRAAQRAGLHEVPVVVVEADDKLALELAIIENIQRSDLNPLDEATGYDQLIAQHGYSQTDLATTLGKSRSHVANTLRLLKLPTGVRGMMARGEITAGHGRALLAVNDPDAVAAEIVAQGLTVRDVERRAQSDSDAVTDAEPRRKGGRPRKAEPAGDADILALERDLAATLGVQVRIQHAEPGGELRLDYGSVEQLDAFCRALRMAGG